MVVVVAVVLVLLGLVLPAATSMWEQRRVAEAQNVINGLLKTSRAKAMSGNRGDMGLFFFVDGGGVQQVVTIARNPVDPDRPTDAPQSPKWQSDLNWRNVFTVTSDRRQSLPPGMRVVPSYAIREPPGGANSHEFFSAAELANDDFSALAAGGDQAQRHRNYFSIVFASDGRLLPQRDVLIRDPDVDGASDEGDGFGDQTGLPVVDDLGQYYRFDSGPADNFLPDHDTKISDLIVSAPNGSVALNFRSVDGLLVYEDSLFRDAGTPEDKRRVLIDTARPFYIHHLTGAVVKGPAAESQ